METAVKIGSVVTIAAWAFAGYCVGSQLADILYRFYLKKSGKKEDDEKGKGPADENGEATEPGTSSMPFTWPPEGSE